MKVLGLKGWENRMRAHNDRLTRQNLASPLYPDFYSHWKDLQPYQHHSRNRHPIQSCDRQFHCLSEADAHRAYLHHCNMARQYEEERFAQMHGRRPRKHHYHRRHRRHHNMNNDYEDENDEGGTDEEFETDEHTDSETSMSYERTRHGHNRRHRPRSRGGRRLHGQHPPRHGNPSYGGLHGPMGYGGYPGPGFYGDDLHEDDDAYAAFGY